MREMLGFTAFNPAYAGLRAIASDRRSLWKGMGNVGEKAIRSRRHEEHEGFTEYATKDNLFVARLRVLRGSIFCDLQCRSRHSG
jgi:hypothetical protein